MTRRRQREDSCVCLHHPSLRQNHPGPCLDESRSTRAAGPCRLTSRPNGRIDDGALRSSEPAIVSVATVPSRVITVPSIGVDSHAAVPSLLTIALVYGDPCCGHPGPFAADLPRP